MPSEHATLTRVPLLDSGYAVELLHARYLTHRFTAHSHDELAVAVVEAGAVRTRLAGGTVVVSEGEILVLNAGDVHTGEAVTDAGYRYRMLYVDAAFLAHVAAGPRAGDAECAVPGFARRVIRDPRLALRLARAHAALASGRDSFAGETELVETLATLVARYAARDRELVARAPATPAADEMVRLVRDYLEAEYARVVTLAELARLTGLSPSYVSRTFRAALGVPPYSYLALVRARRARDLIMRGYALSEVTHATGFSDQSHLTKHFKRVYGLPPGQYARDVGRIAGVGSGDGAGAGADDGLEGQGAQLSRMPVGRSADRTDGRAGSGWPTLHRATA
jgi:AraC-like DNA-binding protein